MSGAPVIHTPADVREMFRAKGLTVSERSIRAMARQTGYCRIAGKALFFLDEDVALLLEGHATGAETMPKLYKRGDG